VGDGPMDQRTNQPTQSSIEVLFAPKNCRLGPVAPSLLTAASSFRRVSIFVRVFCCFFFAVFLFVCCFCASVALRVCQFWGFVSGHTGAFVRLSGAAVLFWCFGLVFSFRIWQCVTLFCCIFWLFYVYLVSPMLGFFPPDLPADT
jgi:hypothetical protein